MALGAAAGAAVTAAPAAAVLRALDAAPHCPNHRRRNQRQQEDIHGVHHTTPSKISAARTISAANHASTHCQITTPVAQRAPSSRRMEAIAATQGV